VPPVNGIRALDAPGAGQGAHLRSQQKSFSDAVTAPYDGPDAARIVTPGPRLSAAERLAIYRDGYRGRLVECLADDYPGVRYLLGAETFESVVHAYIEQHPSQSPNLNAFGRSMPAFLAEHATPLAADLARLEWALVEAIHAAASPPLTIDRLEHMSPAQWTNALLVPAASVRVLRFAYPADVFYQAFRSDEQPPAPGPAPSATLVHRRGWVVWRTELSPPMARLLEALASRVPLGEALRAAMADEDEGTQTSVTRWFQEWVASGVFTAVELPDP
jgi:hypothetical protein